MTDWYFQDRPYIIYSPGVVAEYLHSFTVTVINVINVINAMVNVHLYMIKVSNPIYSIVTQVRSKLADRYFVM